MRQQCALSKSQCIASYIGTSAPWIGTIRGYSFPQRYVGFRSDKSIEELSSLRGDVLTLRECGRRLIVEFIRPSFKPINPTPSWSVSVPNKIVLNVAALLQASSKLLAHHIRGHHIDIYPCTPLHGARSVSGYLAAFQSRNNAERSGRAPDRRTIGAAQVSPLSH